MELTCSKFFSYGLDLAPLGLERRDGTETYFCTPKGARIIGWAGVDGIHFCRVRGFGEMVFAVSPMNPAPHYVHPVAQNFSDFLRLLLEMCIRDSYLIGSANPKPLWEFLFEMKQTLAPTCSFNLGSIPYTGVNMPLSTFDSTQIRKDTGFTAVVPFSEGIMKTYQWVLEKEKGVKK